jgi:hypothetical protein
MNPHLENLKVEILCQKIPMGSFVIRQNFGVSWNEFEKFSANVTSMYGAATRNADILKLSGSTSYISVELFAGM